MLKISVWPIMAFQVKSAYACNRAPCIPMHRRCSEHLRVAMAIRLNTHPHTGIAYNHSIIASKRRLYPAAKRPIADCILPVVCCVRHFPLVQMLQCLALCFRCLNHCHSPYAAEISVQPILQFRVKSLAIERMTSYQCHLIPVDAEVVSHMLRIILTRIVAHFQ